MKKIRKSDNVIDRYFKYCLKNKSFDKYESIAFSISLIISFVFVIATIFELVSSLAAYGLGFETQLYGVYTVLIVVLYILLGKVSNIKVCLFSFCILSFMIAVTNYLLHEGNKEGSLSIFLLGFLFMATATLSRRSVKIMLTIVYTLTVITAVLMEVIIFNNSNYTLLIGTVIYTTLILLGTIIGFRLVFHSYIRLNAERKKLLTENKDKEDTIVRQERTIVLSELITNVFYEIHIPFGAIRVSSDICANSMENIISDLDSISDITLTDDNIKTLKALFTMVLEEAKGEFVKEDIHKKKKVILEILINEGVANSEEVVDSLFELGITNTNIVTNNIDILHKKELKDLLKIIAPFYDVINGIYIIQESSKKNTNILNALKTFIEDSSDTEEGQIDIPISINNVINLYCGTKNTIDIVKKYDDNIPFIWGRKDEINQVWVNIISNALYAMKKSGSITVSIKNLNNKYIRVLINDTGMGIQPEDLSHIFEPLFTTKPKGTGSGLGLHVTRRIVENHNGSITVDSEPDLGTTVIVTLPIGGK